MKPSCGTGKRLGGSVLGIGALGLDLGFRVSDFVCILGPFAFDDLGLGLECKMLSASWQPENKSILETPAEEQYIFSEALYFSSSG